MDDQVLFDLEDFSEEDLIENPTTRTPVCLCLDVSNSMKELNYKDVQNNPQAKEIFKKKCEEAKKNGKVVIRDGKKTVAFTSKELAPFRPISRLTQAVQHFILLLMNDDNVRDSVEVGIVTFADDPVVVRQIARLRDNDEKLIELKIGDKTAMGEGLIKTMNLLDIRKQQFKEAGVAYYQPLLILISDGIPNGKPSLLQKAKDRIHKQVAARKLSIFAIYIGNEKDKLKSMAYLKLIAGPDHVFEMGTANMMSFFEHLSQSVSKQAMSIPGENRSYDTKDLDKFFDDINRGAQSMGSIADENGIINTTRRPKD